MSESPTTPLSLLAAIAQVRACGLVAVKTARNTGINSDYASYADVWAVLNPQLQSAGLSVGFVLGSLRRDESAWVQTITLEVSTVTESRAHSFEFLFPEGNRGVNLSQRQGMAQTYARRYALVSFFHIITGDDDDAARLGMGNDLAEMAITPKADAHFSQFCNAPSLGLGSAETQGAWGNLADPFGDGTMILSQYSENAIGQMVFRDCELLPFKAWLAERVSAFAASLGLTTWEQVRNKYPHSHLMPDDARDLTGDQLRNLSQCLKPAKAK